MTRARSDAADLAKAFDEAGLPGEERLELGDLLPGEGELRLGPGGPAIGGGLVGAVVRGVLGNLFRG